MLCHDYLTSVSCDICSAEIQLEGNYQRRAMNRYARRAGWLIGNQDICPKYVLRLKKSEERENANE